MAALDFEALASELLRSLRGHRSQVAFSRRLKYKSNVAYLWESKRNWPTAAVFFGACERVGIDPQESLARFYRAPPGWLRDSDFDDPSHVARLLRDLRGDTPILELASRMGRSRYAVARWLKGEAEPRLPDFLHLIEATSQRLLDFVSSLVDMESLPSMAAPWRELQAARELVARIPWSPAVLLALQTEDYLALEKHQAGWISKRLGLPLDVEEECMELLMASGQVRSEGERLRVTRIQSIDTRADPSAGQRLREWWAHIGLEHIRAGKQGLFSFNVFSVSQDDYERLQEMHRSYYRAMRAVVAASEPEQRVVVANVQLFALDEEESSCASEE
jgi:transcriptional regulator with XRE-family HTH domain